MTKTKTTAAAVARIDLGAASVETKGTLIVGTPDQASHPQGPKFQAMGLQAD